MKEKDDFPEMIKAAVLTAISRTESRSPAAAAIARKHFEDVQQETALIYLERRAAGAEEDPAKLAALAANTAVVRIARITQKTIYSEELPENRPEINRPTEDDASEIIKYIVSMLPAVYQPLAPFVLKYTAEGYSINEIANQFSQSYYKIYRILTAAKQAAEMEGLYV